MPTDVIYLWNKLKSLWEYIESLFSSGYSFMEVLDADEVIGTDQIVGSGAEKIKGIFGYNTSETEYWLHLYDKASDEVTVGETEAKMTLPIPPSDAGFIIPPSPFGTPFDTACCFAVVDGRMSTDSTGPGDNEVYVGIWY